VPFRATNGMKLLMLVAGPRFRHVSGPTLATWNDLRVSIPGVVADGRLERLLDQDGVRVLHVEARAPGRPQAPGRHLR
jgi:hypothetical protein